jgi:lipid-binding SYLF domain-containing protein
MTAEKLKRKEYDKALSRLQGELVKLQQWVVHKGLKVCVVFEGRDGAGKGGVGIGGAHGSGHVYAKGAYVGDTSMTQQTVGVQLGGQAFSEIIFFEDKRAFDEFTGGNFELGAQATDDGNERRREQQHEQGEHDRRLSKGHGNIYRR